MVGHELELSNGVRVTIPDLDSVVFEIEHDGQPVWLKWSPEFLRDLMSTVMLPGNDRFQLVHAYSIYTHADGRLTVREGSETYLTLTDQELSRVADLYRAVKASYVIWRHQNVQQNTGQGDVTDGQE